MSGRNQGAPEGAGNRSAIAEHLKRFICAEATVAAITSELWT